jgi:hypothetical protein
MGLVERDSAASLLSDPIVRVGPGAPAALEAREARVAVDSGSEVELAVAPAGYLAEAKVRSCTPTRVSLVAVVAADSFASK